MKKKIVLILGSGHLAYRLKKILSSREYEVIHTTIEVINNQIETGSLLENLTAYLEKIDLPNIAMVYLLDEKDENNLQLIIALISLHASIPVTASLFNENLIPHLQSNKDNLTILNPARIAAPFFVAAVYKNIDKPAISIPKKAKDFQWNKHKDSLIFKLSVSFLMVLLASIIFFHFYEKLSWIDAIYFVVVTVSTVGYGDISLSHSSEPSKIFGVLLILTSMFFIWLIFSLTIDLLLKKRIQLALGRKKYTYTNHVVVCGLGRLGYFIVEQLLQKKEKVIIIEQNEDCRHADYFRQLGAEVYIGDARLPKVLADVNVAQARALISVINNDSLNLEIGLNARTYQPGMRLILRIFDEQMAEKIKEFLNIHLTLSASAIADDKFYGTLKNSSK